MNEDQINAEFEKACRSLQKTRNALDRVLLGAFLTLLLAGVLVVVLGVIALAGVVL